ncbi:XRE family transcriptional regulator [Paraburkholderia sp. SG-MS1]|uniref:XRE family transcriptional regulator n=1 Tax=Paraburkholderia sp. SG-MS1 TaxID=2023741 RepID=UPI001580856A|nr:XRE family transcriptional regulator [Paraburkholderia sp. SG-MS1]
MDHQNEGAQRDKVVREALRRFKRDPRKPDDLERLRYNLIVARVMAGLTAVEAAQKLGYANSTQLSLIESGERKTPDAHQFLMDCGRVYSCSVDFLLGLSPHIDESARVAHEHAMARSIEGLGQGIVMMLTNAFAKYTEQAHPVASEYQRMLTAVERVEETINVMRDKYGFDEIPGSAPVLRAVEQLSAIAEPIRDKLRHFQNVEAYIDDVKAGRMPAIPYLSERHAQFKMHL